MRYKKKIFKSNNNKDNKKHNVKIKNSCLKANQNCNGNSMKKKYSMKSNLTSSYNISNYIIKKKKNNNSSSMNINKDQIRNRSIMKSFC